MVHRWALTVFADSNQPRIYSMDQRSVMETSNGKLLVFSSISHGSIFLFCMCTCNMNEIVCVCEPDVLAQDVGTTWANQLEQNTYAACFNGRCKSQKYTSGKKYNTKNREDCKVTQISTNTPTSNYWPS